MKNIELAADALFAGYDGKTIVSDVSITIPQNKISVILGANGCGKGLAVPDHTDSHRNPFRSKEYH